MPEKPIRNGLASLLYQEKRTADARLTFAVLSLFNHI
jgi:hypothetical protein